MYFAQLSLQQIAVKQMLTNLKPSVLRFPSQFSSCPPSLLIRILLRFAWNAEQQDCPLCTWIPTVEDPNRSVYFHKLWRVQKDKYWYQVSLTNSNANPTIQTPFRLVILLKYFLSLYLSTFNWNNISQEKKTLQLTYPEAFMSNKPRCLNWPPIISKLIFPLYGLDRQLVIPALEELWARLTWLRPPARTLGPPWWFIKHCKHSNKYSMENHDSILRYFLPQTVY